MKCNLKVISGMYLIGKEYGQANGNSTLRT